MKRISVLYSFPVIVLLSLNSCTNEELLSEEVPVPVRIAVEDGSIPTRAPVTAIDASNLSSVGIYAVRESGTTGQFPWTASPYLSNQVPATMSNGVVTFSPVIYYPMGGSRLKFYGYFPRTTATSGNNYITAPGSSSPPVFNFTLTGQEDIMYAVSAPTGSYTAGNATLTFNHKLTQIQLNISGLGGALSSIKLIGIKNKGAMNLDTGIITYNSTTVDLTLSLSVLGSTTVPVMVPADVASYRVDTAFLLLLPRSFTIKPVSSNFLPGVMYTITL